MSAQPKEAVGAAYSIESMRYAQAMTWQAIEQLAQRIRPGMLESEARVLGKQVLGLFRFFRYDFYYIAMGWWSDSANCGGLIRRYRRQASSHRESAVSGGSPAEH